MKIMSDKQFNSLLSDAVAKASGNAYKLGYQIGIMETRNQWFKEAYGLAESTFADKQIETILFKDEQERGKL